MDDKLMRLMQLNAEYAAVLDEDRLEAWPEFFVSDCLYKITSADNIRDGNEAGIVYADSRAMLADRVLALRRANIYERQSYRHMIGLPRLRRHSWWCVRCATGAWTFSLPAVTWTGWREAIRCDSASASSSAIRRDSTRWWRFRCSPI